MMGHLEKPKPLKVGGNSKKPKGYNIFTVSSHQKNGAFSSAGDFQATKNLASRKVKPQMDSSDATMFPLLSESSGYAAALMPEPAGNSNTNTPKAGNSSKMHLRFPILSPTREESIVLTRMKTMHKAKQLATSDPNLLMMTKAPGNNWNKKNPGRQKVELEKVSPLAMRDSKTRSVITSRGGFVSTGRSSQATLNEEIGSRLMEKEKTIIPSKHGYHARSHSATYKRLNSVRKTLDELVEEQVVEFQDKVDLDDVLEEMSNVDQYDYASRMSPIALEEGLPTKDSRCSQQLPFRVDRSLYELNDDATMNMDILYKEVPAKDTAKDKPNSGRSFGSKKAIDIVIPTGQYDTPDLAPSKSGRLKKTPRGRQGSRDFEAALKQMRDESEEKKKAKARAPSRKKDKGTIDIKGNKLEFLTDTSIGSTNTTPRHVKSRSRDHSQSPKLSRSSVDVANLPDINVDFMKQKLMSIEAKQKSRIENEKSREMKEKRKEELDKLLKTRPSITRDGTKSRSKGQKGNQGVNFVPESWNDKYKRKNEDEVMFWDSGEENLDDEFDI